MTIVESVGNDKDGNPIFVEQPEPEVDLSGCVCGDGGQHVYHHYDSPTPKISVEVERNSRGYNYKAGISGCRSVAEAISILRETIRQVQAEITNPADKNKAGSDEVKGG